MTTFSLEKTAHQIAEQACQPHSNWQIAERVYLNTLATYAVSHYLQSLGFSTQEPSHDLQDEILQTLMDSAELVVKHYGSVECRRVLPDSNTVTIPEEVWSDRIAFIAVRLDEDLSQAEILGFVDQVQSREIPLSQLRSLEELPAYLHSLKASLSDSLTTLSEWLKGEISSRWREVQDLLTVNHPQLMPAFRGKDQLILRFRGDQEDELKGLSISDLQGQDALCRGLEISLAQQTVSLIILASPSSETEMRIQMLLLPIVEQPFLPPNLQFRVCDEQGEAVIEVQTKEDHERLQVTFESEVGDRFSIQIQLGDSRVTESFLI
ncbi:MAG: DUF1822 family protein [Phormidesmis sp. CAN_BIN44]|nr:DUF1822 family protein [Phormidesmis sp. CAN_BIN44]